MHEGAYRGACAACGQNHVLPQTREAIAEARLLMERLAQDPRFGLEGKMFGVLLGVTPAGEDTVLRAFSGMLGGVPWADGFVGPTRPPNLTAEAERETLAVLRRLGDELASLDLASAQGAIDATRARFDTAIDDLVSERRQKKAARAALRAADHPSTDLAALEAESQREGGRIRALRAERARELAPLEADLRALTARRTELRRERRARSRALQQAMHDSHGLLNFQGRYTRLDEFFLTGVPTGTGECCAPKLLHEAALRGIRPTGVAEFWWGPPPPSGGREHAQFYEPCEEKCGPILGHLLCGLEAPCPPLPILYEDADVIAVDKPAGLLSVPGRTSARADAVETRLALLRPGEFVRPVHRLDQATSGVLLFARTAEAHRRLSADFAAGRVEKQYRARVCGRVACDQGTLDLPLGPDPAGRPRQRVDHATGRPASTHYEVLGRHTDSTDLLLRPRTGRTHQLRVHCAAPEGLGTPILGDGLYGRAEPEVRLHLHASALSVPGPTDGVRLELRAGPPRDWR